MNRKLFNHVMNAAILFLGLFVFGCEKKTTASEAGDCVRTGAVCNDGTTTDATGSGACSQHDGVDYWLCEE